MTRNEQIREVVLVQFQERKDRGLTSEWESVTWLAKSIRSIGVKFPCAKAEAIVEFRRLGYEMEDRQEGRHTRTYIKNPDYAATSSQEEVE